MQLAYTIVMVSHTQALSKLIKYQQQMCVSFMCSSVPKSRQAFMNVHQISDIMWHCRSDTLHCRLFIHANAQLLGPNRAKPHMLCISSPKLSSHSTAKGHPLHKCYAASVYRHMPAVHVLTCLATANSSLLHFLGNSLVHLFQLRQSL